MNEFISAKKMIFNVLFSFEEIENKTGLLPNQFAELIFAEARVLSVEVLKYSDYVSVHCIGRYKSFQDATACKCEATHTHKLVDGAGYYTTLPERVESVKAA